MSDLADGLTEQVRHARRVFEAEVQPLRDALWRYCHGLTGSLWDTEDLVQETMQKAFAQLGGVWQPLNTRAYLFRIASNAWIDHWRREVHGELIELTPDLVAPDTGVDVRIQAHEALSRMVRLLTPLQRAVFLLCDTLDFKAPEVASLLGTSTGAVKAALHRARRTLAGSAPANEEPERARFSQQAMEPLVEKFVAAFDARDPDAIAALMDEAAVTTIVGSAVEFGREFSRTNSLAEWAAEPERQWARPGVVHGRDVLFILASVEDSTCLYSVIELTHDGSRIRAMKNFFYCPELLQHVANDLEMPALTHGHQYGAT